MRTLQLSRDRLASLHAADILLFPGSLTSARLLSWYDHRPDLFLSLFPGDCALSDAEPWGLLCLLALRRPIFQRLVSGELQEHEIDAATMLAGPQDIDICYHVWHVERFEQWDKQTHGSLGSWLAAFLPMFLHSLSLPSSASVSISALTATRGGIHLFTSLGFQERGVYDYVLQDASGKQTVRHCTPPQTLLLQENEQIVQPCPMMARSYDKPTDT